MATVKSISYALNSRAFRRGSQTLRGSHEIIPIEPVHVGHKRQLLMDRYVVDDLNGCHRTVHQPVKHPDNPIISAEQPYEGAGPNSWGTILREPETGLFRIWTSVHDLSMFRRDGKVPAVKRVHYYESDDGLSWRRPELGLCEYAGSKTNNIIMNNCLADYVYVLPLPKRMHDRGHYGMLYCNALANDQIPDPENMHHMRSFVAFSDDGIHWNDAPENPVWCGRTDTNNCIVYNAERDVFMMYRRATINAGEIRRIAYSESKDLISWTQPINIFGHDELDPIGLYGMAVSSYEGIYWGFLMRLHYHPAFEEGKALVGGKDNTMDTELAWSRDSIHWERHPLRPAFIPTSAPYGESYDWGQVRGMANIIEIDDEIRIYYAGHEYLHAPGILRDDDPKTTHICLATLRRDGFVSIDSGPYGGYMLTKPVTYPGGKLHINARTKEDGFVRVAVREGQGVRDGEWPEEWQFDHSAPFLGNNLDHIMAWQHGKSIEVFPSETLRLHFWMEKAELYSFWFE